MNELQTAKELAKRAGEILLEAFHGNSPVRWKGVGNPVTEADSMASSFLVQELRKRFPNDGVLSEEEPDDLSRLNAPRTWIIDPMDGTSEFVSHIGEFTVMIGLAVHGKPTLGVMYQPTEAKLYYGISGGGAFVEQRGMMTSLKIPPKDATAEIVAAVSRSHDSKKYQSIREAIGVGRIISSGGAGLKIGLICEGLADLYIHAGPETSQWDTCAPEVIIVEAGGRITDTFNSPLVYNVEETRNRLGFVASSEPLHDRAIQAVRQFVTIQ
ncbi:MAG TPA: 3'(2'),5'-bisphosphate nucleotidase CysQ [Terriglobia bacterium]|nr:3'(2'),5'-bisphosphate nucleotidase CysQ [Terriglobia bacterium]